MPHLYLARCAMSISSLLFRLCLIFLAVNRLSRADELAGETDGEVINHAEALRACFNEVYNESTPTTFDNYVSGVPTQTMRLHRIWWSKRKAPLPLTIFTTADITRLEGLEAQCKSFPGGAVSVAVYLPLYQVNGTGPTEESLSPENREHLQNITDTLEAFFQKMEHPPVAPPREPCSLRILLVIEIVAEEAMKAMFPVNALRNVAVLAATTPLISMVDVDLAVNIGLTQSVLADPARAAELVSAAEQGPTVFIMPAWATERKLSLEEGAMIADSVAAMNYEEKQKLLTLWHTELKIHPFHFDLYKYGHNATNYEKWFASSEPYYINYSWGYEPWVMAARSALPAYDARFRGYSLNKIVQLEYMNYTGWKYEVLPDVWVIHRPHKPTPTCALCNIKELVKTHGADALEKVVIVKGKEMTGREAIKGRNADIYNHARVRMRRGIYKPVEDPASAHCKAVLPWWGGSKAAAAGSTHRA